MFIISKHFEIFPENKFFDISNILLFGLFAQIALIESSVICGVFSYSHIFFSSFLICKTVKSEHIFLIILEFSSDNFLLYMSKGIQYVYIEVI